MDFTPKPHETYRPEQGSPDDRRARWKRLRAEARTMGLWQLYKIALKMGLHPITVYQWSHKPPKECHLRHLALLLADEQRRRPTPPDPTQPKPPRGLSARERTLATLKKRRPKWSRKK